MFFSNPATEDKTPYCKGEKEVYDNKISDCHNIYAKNRPIMKMIFSIA
jgi:hypothetical protein